VRCLCNTISVKKFENVLHLIEDRIEERETSRECQDDAHQYGLQKKYSNEVLSDKPIGKPTSYCSPRHHQTFHHPSFRRRKNYC
jgi:hypothetical protein